MDKGDPSLCSEVEDPNDLEYCYGRVAGATGREDICFSYIKQAGKDRDSCLSEVGSKTGKLSTCNKIDDDWTKSRCISNGAENTKNPSMCKEASVEQHRDSCYESLAEKMGDPDLCYKAGKSQDDCLKVMGPKEGNPDLCDDIVREDLKDKCYFETADATEESYTCERIKDDDMRMHCAGRIVGNGLNCQNIKDPHTKDRCYSDTAYKDKNANDCENIGAEYTKKTCYEDVASVSGDADLCMKAHSNSIDGCINDAVKASGNEDDCLRINNVRVKNNCVIDAAVKKMDYDVCEKAPQHSYVDECIEKVRKERIRKGEEEKKLTEKLEDAVVGILDKATQSDEENKSSSGGGGFGAMDIINFPFF